MYIRNSLLGKMNSKKTLNNDLVSGYKLAKCGIKHFDSFKFVEEYFNTMKKKPNAIKLGKAKLLNGRVHH